MTDIYANKLYLRAKEKIEEMEDSYNNVDKHYKNERSLAIVSGSNKVVTALKDIQTDCPSAIAQCGMLLSIFQKIKQKHPKILQELELQDQFFVDDMMNNLERDIHLSYIRLSAINPYILDRLELSIKYTQVLYDENYLNGIP